MTKLRATLSLGQNYQLLVKLSDLQLTRAFVGGHTRPHQDGAWGVNGLKYRPNGTLNTVELFALWDVRPDNSCSVRTIHINTCLV